MKNEIIEYITKISKEQTAAINKREQILSHLSRKFIIKTWEDFANKLCVADDLFGLFGVEATSDYEEMLDLVVKQMHKHLLSDEGCKVYMYDIVEEITVLFFEDTSKDASFSTKLSICLWVVKNLSLINSKIDVISVEGIQETVSDSSVNAFHRYLLNLIDEWINDGIIYECNGNIVELDSINMNSFKEYFTSLSKEVNLLKGSEFENARDIDDLRKLFKNLEKRFEEDLKNRVVTNNFVADYKQGMAKLSKIKKVWKTLSSSLDYVVDKTISGAAIYLAIKTPE